MSGVGAQLGAGRLDLELLAGCSGVLASAPGAALPRPFHIALKYYIGLQNFSNAILGARAVVFSELLEAVYILNTPAIAYSGYGTLWRSPESALRKLFIAYSYSHHARGSGPTTTTLLSRKRSKPGMDDKGHLASGAVCMRG